MSTDSGDRVEVEGWTDDRDRVVSVADVTHVLTGQVVGEEGPRTTCAICSARLEAGDVVSAEAVKREAWNEWVVRLVKCLNCCRGELALEYGYFSQVLVRAMLLRAENVATGTAHHALTNVSLAAYDPQGSGVYVDPDAFDEELQFRLGGSNV